MKAVRDFSNELSKTEGFTRASLTVAVKLQRHKEIDASIVDSKNALNKEWFYKVRK